MLPPPSLPTVYLPGDLGRVFLYPAIPVSLFAVRLPPAGRLGADRKRAEECTSGEWAQDGTAFPREPCPQHSGAPSTTGQPTGTRPFSPPKSHHPSLCCQCQATLVSGVLSSPPPCVRRCPVFVSGGGGGRRRPVFVSEGGGGRRRPVFVSGGGEDAAVRCLCPEEGEDAAVRCLCREEGGRRCPVFVSGGGRTPLSGVCVRRRGGRRCPVFVSGGGGGRRAAWPRRRSAAELCTPHASVVQNCRAGAGRSLQGTSDL